MKKNISINLFGTLYAIDDDAYQLLERYLSEMKNYFKNQEGGEEIADDIEHRIAELFWEKKEQGLEAINIEDVKEIIQKIGNPQEMGGEQTQAENAEYTKAEEESTGTLFDKYLKSLKGRKMYRDTSDKMLGGVCSGLTRYLGGSDPLPARIILVLLTLFTNSDSLPFFWIWVVGYLVCWVIMPEANTPADKLKMEGKKVTPESLQQQILNDEAEKENNAPRRQSTASGCLGTILRFIIFAFLAFWGFILLIILLSFFCAGMAVIPAVFGIGSVEVFGMDAGNGFIQFLQDNSWSATICLISGIIAVVIPFYGILRAIFSSSRISKGQLITLLIIWVLALGTGIATGTSMIANFEKNKEKYEKLGFDSRGPIVTQPYDFRDFDELNISNAVEVYYTQADTFDVSLEIPESKVDSYKVYQQGNKLVVDAKNKGKNRILHGAKLYVSAPELKNIQAQGACVFQAEMIEQDSLTMNLEGSSRIRMDKAIVKNMTITTQGSSKINKLNAISENFTLNAEGASKGNLNIRGGKCKLTTEGASSLDLYVECDEVSVTNSGASRVHVSGNAKTKDIHNTGAGKVSTVGLQLVGEEETATSQTLEEKK